jgi:hypothetical protein
VDGSAGFLAPFLKREFAVPDSVVRATIHSASRYAVAKAPGVSGTTISLTGGVFTLAEGVMTTMIATKMKISGILLALTMILAGTVSVASFHGFGLSKPGIITSRHLRSGAKQVVAGERHDAKAVVVRRDEPRIDGFEAVSEDQGLIKIPSFRKARKDPRNKEVFGKLEMIIPFHFADDVSTLQDVIAYIKEKTKTGPNDPGLSIVVEQKGLDNADKTLASPLGIDIEGIPLRISIDIIVRQLGMTYYVRDGGVYINWSKYISWNEKNRSVERRLDKIVDMKFPKGVSLKEFLKFIVKASKKDPDDKDIPVYIYNIGDHAVAKTIDSPLQIMEGRKSLDEALDDALRQLNYSYFVQNGVLIITRTKYDHLSDILDPDGPWLDPDE